MCLFVLQAACNALEAERQASADGRDAAAADAAAELEAVRAEAEVMREALQARVLICLKHGTLLGPGSVWLCEVLQARSRVYSMCRA